MVSESEGSICGTTVVLPAGTVVSEEKNTPFGIRRLGELGRSMLCLYGKD